jgi:hypothetical protein
VIEMYLEAWQAEGESIPEPCTLQIAWLLFRNSYQARNSIAIF